jgi:hypothetical protein
MATAAIIAVPAVPASSPQRAAQGHALPRGHATAFTSRACGAATQADLGRSTAHCRIAVSHRQRETVDNAAHKIDEKVKAFLNRPIEGDWPFIWLDAPCIKTRQAGRIVSIAAIVAVGINTEGRREVLGLSVGASEAEIFWTDFLRQLTRRGLRGSNWSSLMHTKGLKPLLIGC